MIGSRILLAALLLVMIAAGAAFTQFIAGFGDRVERSEFEAFTATAAAALEPEVVAGFRGGPEDSGTAAFDVVRAELKRIRTAAPHARFVYLMAKKDGHWIFLADAEDASSPAYSPPGEVYDGETGSLDEVLTTGRAQVQGPSRDAWGVWVTGEAPIKNPRTGQVIAVFGIDIDAGVWAGEVQRYRWFGIGVSGLFLAVAVIGAVGMQVRARRRETEKELAAIVRSAHGAIIGGDAAGRITSWNPGAVEVYGYAAAEMIGQSVELLAPEDRKHEVRQQVEKVLAGEAILDFETVRVTKSGLPIDVSESISPIRDPTGQIIGASAIVFDISRRKKAERALSASRRILEGILNTIPARVFWKDKDLVYLGCNQAFARDAGFADPEDIVGKTDDQMGWHEQAERYRRDDREVIESGRPKLLIEEPQTTPQGKKITLLTSKIPLRNEKGDVEGVLGTYLDITAYKQAVDARQASEERYRVLFETTPDAILTLEPPSWHFKSANPAAVKLYGARSEADLVAYGPWEPSPERQPDGRLSDEKAKEMIETAMREGSHFFEWTHRRMDGTEFPTDVLLTRTFQAGNAVVYATVRDITERKLAEQTKAQLAAVVESSRTGIIGVDLDGTVTSWNEGAARIYGYNADEIVGRSVEILYGPDFTMGIRERLRKIESGQEPMTRELVRIRKDGRRVDILQTFSPVRDSAGKLVGASSVNLDITDKKEAERSLERVTQTLKTLSRTNEALIRATSREMLFDSMCRIAVESGGYRMAWVGVAEQDADKTVRPVAWAGHVDGYLDGVAITWADVPRGRGPVGVTIRTGEVQVEQDVGKDLRMAPWRDAALKRGYRSSIALPLREGSSVIGALSIYAAEPDALGAEEIHLLMELANDISFGLTALKTRADRETAMARLERSVEETVQAVASTVEMRDAYTAGHQRRVTIIAEAIARELGLPAEKIRGLRMASMVHDLGKINIPAEILSKPSKLSAIEFRIIKTHPQVGYDILKPVEFPWPIADIVLQHHERLDGSGYPQGLKGDQILLEARVLAVADVVEAMMSHRPFRPALGLEVALDEIRQGSGRLYDPAVVQACLKVMREGGLHLELSHEPERVRPPAGD